MRWHMSFPSMVCGHATIRVPMHEATPETIEQIEAVCLRAMALAPAEWLPDLPSSERTFGHPEWYQFENQAWPMGETIRQAFVRFPKLRKPAVFNTVAEVACCRTLRRGRQSFVMAMGYSAARDCAPSLIPLLCDPDVAGHTVDTLLKMRAAGFAREVRPLLNADRTWIRKLAGRYLDRYPG